MKRTPVLVSLFSLIVLALPVLALGGPSIDWESLYTWEPGATATNSLIGAELEGVGIVIAFESPFGDLDPNDPATEYTIYIHDLISQGTTAVGPPATTLYTTLYSGGTIEIYAGTPRNASFDPNPPNGTVPANFTDGTLILSGTFDSFFTVTNNFTTFSTGNLEGTIAFTGGTLLDRVSNNGQPCPGLFTGGITWNPGVLIPGYVFKHDGKIDINCPTPVESSRWGLIKSSHGGSGN